jgi:hypothetical protein
MIPPRYPPLLWLEAAFELLRARLLLWLWPQRTLASLRLAVSDPAPLETEMLVQAADGADALAAIDRAILSASYRLLGSQRPCLPQAMAALRMAARRGSVLRLRFGVLDRQADRLTAHAWAVTADRRVVGSHRALALCSDALVRRPSQGASPSSEAKRAHSLRGQ